MPQAKQTASRQASASKEEFWQAVRRRFMLPEDEIYLNTGSWGSLPRTVFDAVVQDLEILEGNPSRNRSHLTRKLNEARQKLGHFVGAPARDISFLPNVTVAINMVVHGQEWQPGDEILASDQEYGAIDNCLHHAEKRWGVKVKRAQIPIPPPAPEAVVEAFQKAITRRTRLLLCSHITTRTGLIAPIAQLADLAHNHGAQIAIDGAHGPGMVPLDLAGNGCDFYGGNCHKWLCAPKGTGFLYARPEVQEKLHHLIVSWGYSQTGYTRDEDGRPQINNQPYMWQLEHWGTRDMASYGAVAEAVELQEEIGRDRVRARGRELASYLRNRLMEYGWATLLTPDHPDMSGAITTFHYAQTQLDQLSPALYDTYRITTPISEAPNGVTQRVSTHIYNTFEHIDLLVDALNTLRE